MLGGDRRLSITVGPGEHHPTWNPAALSNVAEFVEGRAGGSVWVRFAGKTNTSETLVSRAAAWSATLRGLGVGLGIRVGLLMRNRPEFIVAWIAINRLGAVAVFLPATMPPALLEQYAAVAEIDALLGEVNLFPAGLAAPAAAQATLVDDIVALRLASGRQEAPGRAADGDPAAILFTSGTSGLPKAVVFSHRYVLELGYTVTHGKGFETGERLFFCSPMFHGDGILATLISLIVRGELHLASRFSASTFWQDVARDQSTMFYFVGATLSFLLRSEAQGTPMTALRFTTGGGAPDVIARAFEARFGIPVLEAYSQTECLSCCSNTLAARRSGTVGRPYPGIEVRIVDNLDQPVPVGEVGEIVVRPPRPWMCFTEYFGNAPATSLKMRNLLLHTGDLGSMDADGFIKFHGRLGHGLRRRGENLLPEQIELLVEQLPWVRKAAAVGLPSEHGDQDILLLVNPSGAVPSRDDIATQIISVLPRVMHPRFIELVPELPMTATNKLSRRDLPRSAGSAAIEIR